MILFHASKTPGLKELQPHVSNHNHPLVYCSSKPENTLVYLSNAIEKYCKETGFSYNGVWHKWATYGFTPQGKFHLEEYDPDATKQTYEGVAGYLYSTHKNRNFC